jgi:molybdenum cofactor cytidylyltransferase
LKEELHIAILIMAAGASRRMEGIKLLLPWKSSNFLLETIKTARESEADSFYVVLGANAGIITTECNLKEKDVTIFINPDWSSGLGKSIAYGVKKIMKTKPLPDAILVCLADQPLITPTYLNLIINTFKRDTSKIISTSYRNRAGVPALFPKSHYTLLVHLEGDQGAKDLLESKMHELIKLDAKDQLIDIDTKNEYEQLQHDVKNEKKNN